MHRVGDRLGLLLIVELVRNYGYVIVIIITLDLHCNKLL